MVSVRIKTEADLPHLLIIVGKDKDYTVIQEFTNKERADLASAALIKLVNSVVVLK